MKPYDYIFHIVDDIVDQAFAYDHTSLAFTNDLRFDHITFQQREKEKWHRDLPFSFIIHNHRRYADNKHIYDNSSWKESKKYKSFKGKLTNKFHFIQHHWEPVDYNLDKIFWDKVLETYNKHKIKPFLLHSEHNNQDITILNNKGVKDIHWFAHAYLCSEFYFKHYQKLKMVTDYKARSIQHRWLCTNRLIRKHRTDFLEMLNLDRGCYSLLNPDPNGIIYQGPVAAKSFDVHENHSAEIKINDLTPWNTSFLHVVSETVWQEKIHFTEKVFKPVVLHQPFVVLQAPGSLAYLRSYGFKTFDKWWDESYDTIEDPAERMQAIADIVNSIGAKSLEELETMRMEMASVLEHNFRHFYENIPAICLDELRKGIANL